MDLSIYHSLNDFAYEHSLVGDLAKFFAQYAVFIPVAAVALVWLAGPRRVSEGERHAAFAAGVATLLALVIVKVVNDLWDRTRPFVHHAHHLLIAHGKDASFPSDHTSGAFAIAFTLLLFGSRRLGWAALVFGVLIGVARIMVGVHYPTDVLGGVAIGGLAALIVWAPPVRDLLCKMSDRLTQLYPRRAPSPSTR